jgi:iron-sulfur cluster repair protein YtfE (RIC family)
MQSAKKTSNKEESNTAIAMLMEDHQRVRQLFAEYKKLKDSSASTATNDQKAKLVAQVCQELLVHAQVEEEIFYPAIAAETTDSVSVNAVREAAVEHAGAKDLIGQLLKMTPGDDLYDAKVTVLSESIEHHVKEEEGSMFPQARKAAGLDVTLGDQMLQRKQELLAEMELPKAKQPVPATAKKSQGVQAAAH